MNFFNFFTFTYDEVFAMQLLAVSFSVVWIFYPWKKERKSILIGIVQVIALFAIGTLLNWFLFALAEVWRAIAGLHFQIAWLLMIVLYLILFDRTYVASRLIMGATLFITVIATADLGREVMFFINESFPDAYADYPCYIADLLVIGFGVLISRFSLKNYSDVPKASVAAIMTNTVIFTSLIVVKTVSKMKEPFFGGDSFYCLTLTAIYIASVTGYMMVFFHSKAHQENTALAVQNKLLKADKQTLIVSRQAIEEMRSWRHDMKNQQKVMSLMLEEERYDDLREYFRSVSEKIDQNILSEFIDCGNQLISSVINMEVLKATSYGLKLFTKINVPPSLPFEPDDLCRILVNLIDNAIEGVMRTDSRDYLIDVKIGRRTDYLYICVQNEIRDDTDRAKLLEMNTVKDDAVNHGYGHKIVKKIVEKYNGCVNYSIVENEFVAEVMLDMNPA